MATLMVMTMIVIGETTTIMIIVPPRKVSACNASFKGIGLELFTLWNNLAPLVPNWKIKPSVG